MHLRGHDHLNSVSSTQSELLHKMTSEQLCMIEERTTGLGKYKLKTQFGEPELRLKINGRERKRMHDLNVAMDGLREVMPYAHGPSNSPVSDEDLSVTFPAARGRFSSLDGATMPLYHVPRASISPPFRNHDWFDETFYRKQGRAEINLDTVDSNIINCDRVIFLKGNLIWTD
ncbi:hypothetical protein AAFF_G00380700 [Aldrovandia affinis]|uniref:BHLH domain-containing protein n=1 Tax=Aldrovandia affinis TaxID=143900 RepID=A0AAD7T8A1_9TELE|nr:hypothetical protein AAFF_G00380700 [Aldrovandia affinis]